MRVSLKRQLTAIDRLLVKEYGEPKPWEEDPLDSLIGTILSQNTNDKNSGAAYDAMRKAFPAWEDVMKAAPAKLEAALRPGGLAKTKSRRIQRILREIAKRGELSPPIPRSGGVLPRVSAALGRPRTGPPLKGGRGDVEPLQRPDTAPEKTSPLPPFKGGPCDNTSPNSRIGVLSLQYLAGLPAEAAEKDLLKFHGVGRKTARCVLLFALHKDVFPIDTHIERVLKRLGLLPDGIPAERAHTFIGPAIPAGRSLALHLNLIFHGRAICHARSPECARCILRRRCPYPRI